jgi:hypothetical protein
MFKGAWHFGHGLEIAMMGLAVDSALRGRRLIVASMIEGRND